jgi:hypothetical protein
MRHHLHGVYISPATISKGRIHYGEEAFLLSIGPKIFLDKRVLSAVDVQTRGHTKTIQHNAYFFFVSLPCMR